MWRLLMKNYCLQSCWFFAEVINWLKPVKNTAGLCKAGILSVFINTNQVEFISPAIATCFSMKDYTHCLRPWNDKVPSLQQHKRKLIKTERLLLFFFFPCSLIQEQCQFCSIYTQAGIACWLWSVTLGCVPHEPHAHKSVEEKREK